MKVSKEDIVKDMIKYIEEEERNIQAAKMANDTKVAKTDIVNGILSKLEKELTNEN